MEKKVAASLNTAGDLEDKIDLIINLMRGDLGIEFIDRRLKKRARP